MTTPHMIFIDTSRPMDSMVLASSYSLLLERKLGGVRTPVSKGPLRQPGQPAWQSPYGPRRK